MKVLITGMSGTGKSSVITELVRRGYTAVDVDHPDWSYVAADGEWIWREDSVSELLDSATGELLFVSGCAENQVGFHAQFDIIVLLSASQDIILERLMTRTTNDYGKHPHEVREVLANIREIEPLLRRVAHHENNTSAPLNEVVDRLLQRADLSGTLQ